MAPARPARTGPDRIEESCSRAFRIASRIESRQRESSASPPRSSCCWRVGRADVDSSMKFGIFLPPFGPFGDPRLLVELAESAEAAGWDGFFLWDHLMHRVDGDYMDAWLVLAAIAARTQRLRLGPMVTPLPRRRPWKVAREAVTLDHLSGGRAGLGAGIGTDHSGEFSAVTGEALTDDHRAELLDEGLEIITRLWTGEHVMFTGHHRVVTDVQFLPRPVQQPRVPIWCGAHWPNRAPLRRA